MSAPRRSPDIPPPLGITLYDGGAEVAVLARHAEAVELCLFDDGVERRVPLTRTAYGIWWDQVEGITPGQRYGLRVHGPWVPERGLRHNPAKLLLDPYAKAIEGEVVWGPEVFGHLVDEHWRGDGETASTLDSAAFVPRCVVLDDTFDWGEDRPPAVPWSSTVIYEAHVRGLTKAHPAVPEELRGTYAALGHPAILEHLTHLGVTTLELQPIHCFTSEPALVRRGLSNYWGYNTLGFFAPHAPYAAAREPRAVADELKGAVKALHAAGIEVVLDVVYNHTAEQGSQEGPTLSWRGMDNATYYRLDERGRDVDVTGCGNTVDLRSPMVVRMVLDSMRRWVSDFHVDGFRFDLAPALARGRDDAYDVDHAFHVALRADPLLSTVKLIAEPWDLGVHGWRTGAFPPPFAEWNDRFRDTVRTFWLVDTARSAHGAVGHGTREVATRVAGSADLFTTDDRGPIASVNYVASHDGFTLADLTAYNKRHNRANGEGNRDGSQDNRSWNHGVEGPTDDRAIQAERALAMRNLLASTLLSCGVPMIRAGDELGRSQGGNNNAYCQDNPISWLDWDLTDWQRELSATVAALTRVRREHPVLRPTEFPTFEPTPGRPRLRWLAEDGKPVTATQWHDPGRRVLAGVLDNAHESADPDVVLLVFHAGLAPTRLCLPEGIGDLFVAWVSGAGVELTDGVLHLPPSRSVCLTKK